MTDWNSPATLAANYVSFTKFIHALLGIFAWEWLISLDFDIALLTGKRKFRWPLIFYLYGRYGILTLLIIFVIMLDSPTEINCTVAYGILATLGTTCLGVASINLYLRTIAIWGKNPYIVWPLLTLSAGHFGIIIRSTITAKSKWVDGSGCVTIDVEPKIYAAMFIYTMVLDFIILILTGYKLWSMKLGTHYSAMMKLLFTDGLVYFIVAFTVNTIAVIFSLMHLNPIMALIADIPSTMFSTIAAGRVVRRLSNHATGDRDVVINSNGLIVNSQSVSSGERSKNGIHIEMARFTVPDDERSMPGGYEKGSQVQPSDLEANEFLHTKQDSAR